MLLLDPLLQLLELLLLLIQLLDQFIVDLLPGQREVFLVRVATSDCSRRIHYVSILCDDLQLLLILSMIGNLVGYFHVACHQKVSENKLHRSFQIIRIANQLEGRFGKAPVFRGHLACHPNKVFAHLKRVDLFVWNEVRILL